MSEQVFDISLRLEDEYRFDVDFNLPDVPALHMDEPEPLGGGEGPNAARLLAAAVGNCLASSALFCLRKARIPVQGMRVDVRTTLGRNEAGRLRVHDIGVTLHAEVPDDEQARMARCLDLFEDFCLVTESVRKGIQVDVDVEVETPTAEEVTG
ncbi:MAG: OsmC family protein [Gemmatimonadales bacterium]|jgi:organic hydroperoxide reductase OsmC/OhrA